MNRLLLVLCLVMLSNVKSFCQVVQWASKVIEVSSELTPVQYSAQQALGKPNVLPAAGQNPNAWTPDKPKRKEFIKLGYDNPIQIQQIAIAESNNPSGVYKVSVFDVAGKEYPVQTFSPQAIPLKGRMLNVFVQKTTYKVNAIKIEFDGAALSDYFSIDAVAITDSNLPIVATINIPELMSKGLITDHLDANVNSEYNDLNAILSPDGKTLYFSRRNHPGNIGGVNDKEDIWYSNLGQDGKWQVAQNMGPKFNNESPNFINAINSVTPDGKSAIMVLGNQYINGGKKMLAGISMSSNVNGEWTAPKPVKIENDYNFNEKANYFLANSRKALLMSIEREDSYGDRDIYVSFPKADNDSAWTQPLNLGKIINTASEESCPFLASDNRTMYFSSKGYSGFGGSDIYRSIRLDDTWTSWTEPENLGPEINSKFDDLFFNIPSSSEYAYFSKGVTDNNIDIFRLKLPAFMKEDQTILVKGKLLDSKTKAGIGAKIIYESLPDGKQIGSTESNPETGDYEIRLPVGKMYGVHAEANGHMSTSQNLDLRKTAYGKEYNIDLAPIELAKVEENTTLTLNNIFFDYNKAVLKSESFPELNRIVKMMDEKTTIEVEISGHTDPVGPDDYNMKLSEKRAKSVAAYLIDKGIVKERIKVTFFGETRLIDTTNTPEGNKKNRRVEFKILKT